MWIRSRNNFCKPQGKCKQLEQLLHVRNVYNKRVTWKFCPITMWPLPRAYRAGLISSCRYTLRVKWNPKVCNLSIWSCYGPSFMGLISIPLGRIDFCFQQAKMTTSTSKCHACTTQFSHIHLQSNYTRLVVSKRVAALECTCRVRKQSRQTCVRTQS